MGSAELFQVRGGLATLGPELLAVRDLLETRILAWASQAGATVMHYPPLLRAEDLDLFDYFQNFPHLALVASRIRPELLENYAKGEAVADIPHEQLTSGTHVLPSAACFNVFLDLRDRVLLEPRVITTVATCFRNEDVYDDLQRLWAFTMREIVCLGPVEAVKAHLESFKERILDFARAIDLPLAIETASDPFFQKDGPRALMQKLFPQKEEFVYGESLAIGSLNFHRNFFGERCGIQTAEGEPVFSGCVAFGIERWLHALLDRYGGSVEKVVSRLDAI